MTGKILSLGLYLFFMVVSQSAKASSFDLVIAKAFPGYQILKRDEFDSEILKFIKTEPGVVVGKFDSKSKGDFAALLRHSEKKKYLSSKPYDYYDGKFVVCHEQGGDAFQCKELEKMPIVIPYSSYLVLTGNKKTSCIQSSKPNNRVDVKTDAIGWYTYEKGGSDWIRQADGSS